VFGRVTYDMMARFWPTEQAAKAMPEVAEGMNRMEKIVFSRNLKQVDWRNTRLVNDDPETEMPKIKTEPGPDITIMGSGQIIGRLAQAGLIDSYSFVVCPIVLGAGRTLFEGLQEKRRLELQESRAFKNGKIFTRYSV
jgi:dihydrofolate reductase